MENSFKAKRPSSDRPHKTRTSDDARVHTHDNPRVPPQTSFISGSPPREIASSPQISTQIVQGPLNGVSQPNAAWHASQRRPESDGYSRTPQPRQPQNGFYPLTPYGDGPPGGVRPQGDASPATGYPSRSSTHPTPGFNPPADYNTAPSRKAAQFADSRKVKVSYGHFALLTDAPLTDGDYAVVRGADELDISGGQFVIGNSIPASTFLNNTAETARIAFNKDESSRGNNGRKLEELEEEPRLC